MSNKIHLPYAQVMLAAQEVIKVLEPACDRIEIAGSLRRKCELVGDIEIIAIPKPLTDLFGSDLPDAYELDLVLAGVEFDVRKNGPKFKQFCMMTSHGSALVDLFLQPDPATWGVNFMLRTGSEEFSHRMVTSRLGTTREGMLGLRPPQYIVEAARVWLHGEALDTPEEEDVFRLWDMPLVPPEKRTADYSIVPLEHS